jgi:hypothetical protein
MLLLKGRDQSRSRPFALVNQAPGGQILIEQETLGGLVTCLRFLFSDYLERGGLSTTLGDADALVFTNEDSGAQRYTNWRRRVWSAAVRAAGCESAGFHDLRWLNATAPCRGRGRKDSGRYGSDPQTRE